jgi:hypothetical protein
MLSRVRFWLPVEGSDARCNEKYRKPMITDLTSKRFNVLTSAKPFVIRYSVIGMYSKLFIRYCLQILGRSP